MEPKPSDENEEEPFSLDSFNCLLLESSIHGVKYLSQKDRPVLERLVWLVLIIGSTIGAAYFVQGVMQQYYSSPVIVSFQTAQTSVAQIPYPAISICNINRFRKSGFLKILEDAKQLQDEEDAARAAKDLVTLQAVQKQLGFVMKMLRAYEHICAATKSFHVHLNYSINETTTNLKSRGLDLEYDMRITLKDFYYNPELKELWSKYGRQTCEEMIPLCLWEGDPFNCSSSFMHVETRFGPCCTFNMIPPEFFYKLSFDSTNEIKNLTKEDLDWQSFDMDRDIIVNEDDDTDERNFPRRQSKAGQGSGLSFLVNPELNEYYCGGNSAFGFRVLAHPPIESPRIKDFGMAVGPGTEVFMNVQADLTIADDSIKDLDPQTRYCYFAKEQPLDLFYVYTQNNCIDECLARMVLANCSCITYDLPVPKLDLDLVYCEEESLQCSEKLRAHILQLAGDVDDFNSTYCKNCFPSCNRIDYRVQTSTLPLRKDERIWMDKNNETPSWAKEKVSIVHVYFGSDSVYSRVRKKLYGTNDLIANIGGILGLFLGMSIIGIIEPAFYIVKLIYFKISQRKAH